MSTVTGESPPDSIDRWMRLDRSERNRSRLIFAGVLAVCTIGAAAFWWTTMRSELPDPPEKALESVRKVLPKIDAMPSALRLELAGEALYELEPERLPPKLRDAFQEFQRVPPSMTSLVAMRALAEPTVLEIWNRACDGGATKLAAVVQAHPRSEAAHELFEKCGLDRYGFLSAREVEGHDAPTMALAFAAYEQLKSKKGLLVEEESLLRLIVTSTD